ncbi:Hypothetical protein NTJ_15628 [Nesidiocoris tenuis]|uniref:Uncharacterized protein n=1 Tax=Nesidiocoris tenuis TaxID=355587 RepID=A0ABN7BEK3_9HEMI|nr:Hypothetical protein NTJ_15628 [Nesidiocoris tenuis]
MHQKFPGQVTTVGSRRAMCPINLDRRDLVTAVARDIHAYSNRRIETQSGRLNKANLPAATVKYKVQTVAASEFPNKFDRSGVGR